MRDGHIIRIKSKEREEEVLLNERDELWTKFRHMHIADVLGGLSEYLESIKARNPQAARLASGADGSTIQDISKFVKALPEYQAQLEVYSQHLQIAQACMSHIQGNGQALLNLITNVQQTLATGFDQHGKTLRLPLVIDSMLDDMSSGDGELKLRLILILVASQREKLSEVDLERVCSAAGFTGEQRRVIAALRSLDATSVDPGGAGGAYQTSSTGKKGRWPFSKKLFSSSPTMHQAGESDFASSRFVCPIKAISDDLVGGKLSTVDFPALDSSASVAEVKAGAQSVRRSPGWGKHHRPPTPRSILFMAGGLTYAEIQAISVTAAESEKEIIAGGTSILTAQGFIEGLGFV